uniref:Nematode cuticle collagen N-terminal domain-containing protein n=1 Tax=Panagrolaimus sp. PS1159 TaxID=55785 RepID=A0AC35FCI3_9BILA
MDSKPDIKELLAEAHLTRKFAFFGTAVSVVATLTAAVFVPMLFSYVQHIQSSLQVEMEFCTHQTQNLLREISKYETSGNFHKRLHKRETEGSRFSFNAKALSSATFDPNAATKAQARVGRQGGYGGSAAGQAAGYGAAGVNANSATAAGSGSCCSCGVGEAGPVGPPGTDGSDGKDGSPGNAGAPGSDASTDSQPAEKDFCFECAPSPAGPAGNP